jgi:hypothetical protein
VELCINCKESLLVMCVIVPLFFRLELKKKKLLQSLGKGYVVTSNIRGYQREGPSTTTW